MIYINEAGKECFQISDFDVSIDNMCHNTWTGIKI